MTVNIAPDPENLQVGKGIVSFKPDGETEFVDLGNCPEIEYEPTIERLDHFTSRAGIRTKDKSVVIERGGSLRILMEEITAFNLSMLMMGTVGNDGPAGEASVDIFTADTLRGELKYQATNDIGPKWDMHFYNVEFAPSGSFNPISDEWNNIEVTGEVLIAPEGHEKAGKVGLAWITNAGLPSPAAAGLSRRRTAEGVVVEEAQPQPPVAGADETRR